MRMFSIRALLVLALATGCCDAFARGGRGGLNGIKDDEGRGKEAPSSQQAPKPSSVGQWLPVPGLSSVNGLKLRDGRIQFIDTQAPALVNQATNPTGAVSVVKKGAAIYCTASSCSACKIPLNKAKILVPTEETGGTDPRIACDFCKAAYNLRTGKRVASVGGGGLVGGIVKGLFSQQSEEPLPVYALGEKDGRVLINLG